MRNTFYGLLLLSLFSPIISVAQEVSLEQLLKEMSSREAIARFPEPEFFLGQASSYDRRAKVQGGEDWYANTDSSNFIRIEENDGRKEYVLLDEQGPGAIVRFWMTYAPSVEESTLRIYLDGADTAAISGNSRKLLGGATLVGYPLSAAEPLESLFRRRGYNLYLPIPYAKSCKITFEIHNESGVLQPKQGVFYNINFRKYVPGTEVITYSKDQLDENEKLLEKVKEALHTQYYRPAEGTKIKSEHNIKLEEGQTHVFAIRGQGNRAINKIRLKIDARDLDQALRSTVLKIKFDGKSTVWSPIGDFFGTGYHLRTVRNWYTQVEETGWMTCYWVMPFQKEARIEVENLGDQPVTIKKLEVGHQPWQWDDRSMYFGASWKQYSSLHTSKNNERFDVNFTKLQGEGVYVGDVLTLFNTLNGWWGEGDEKIYIDGETFPSHFGTGTEDYYGYAWSRWENIFSHPYIGQPDGGGNMKPGYTVNLRFRGLDGIPFHESLKVDMEMWHWFKHTRINYAPTTFFYLKPDARSLVEPDEENARVEVAYHRSDFYSQLIENGRFEVENALTLKNTSSDIIYQYYRDERWSNHTQLLWKADEPNDELVLGFRSDQPQKVKVYANLTKSPRYGKFTLSLNGKKANHVWDGYNENGVTTKKVLLGTFKLKQGRNRLHVKFLEAVPNRDNGLFGIDYLEFSEL